MRALSAPFMANLLQAEGILHPLLERIHHDDTLMLAIRDGYINIYYRGGNLVRITETGKDVYSAVFDTKYNILHTPFPILPGHLKTQEETTCWVTAFGTLKTMMDGFFVQHPKLEREFQQVVTRINNASSLSNATEYFITDIEFADPVLNARFDLMGIRWLASQRTNGKKCRAVLMEMKYGDAALGGNAGILKHLQDFSALLSDQTKVQEVYQTIESQFNQFDQLGLLQFNHCTNGTHPQLDAEEKPEVIFLLANHNPRSTKLATLLNDPLLDEYANSPYFDLRFSVSHFSGYALHQAGMVSLDEFRKLLNA